MPARRLHPVPAPVTGELEAALAALRDDPDVPGAFGDDVRAEAEAAARTVPTDPAAAGLPDLRGIPFVTIDPPGSTDLDQALHLARDGDGAVLHYAIADVAAFVAPGGAVDREARERGQTLYAVDGRIPLHPEVLSEDAASLLPERDRRAYVWRFVLDARAEPVEVTLTRGIVRSRAQWTYEDAQRAIEDGTAPEAFAALDWFGAERLERERERGGASLDVPETEVVREDGGYRLERRGSLPVEEWNAQVSLLTGMAAARIMLDGGIGVLRTMPPASAEDIAAFRAQTVALGLPWADGVPYGEYLHGLPRRSAAALAVREAAAGLFRGADYAPFDGTPPERPEQAAITAPYAHATAPLRRLVDRWSLAICEALANGRPVPDWARDGLEALPAAMARSSQRAGRLESEGRRRVEAAVLTGREGAEFRGVVLRRRGEDGVLVQLFRPPMEAAVAPADAAPGSRIRLRLEETSIARGVVRFSALGPVTEETDAAMPGAGEDAVTPPAP